MTLCFLEVPVGRRSPNTPPLVKHLVRFGRRLREHGVHHGSFPPFVDSERQYETVLVGRRIVNVFDNGEVTSSLRSSHDKYDRLAMTAHRNRWHALWLRFAADSRKRGWLKSARSDLNVAINERRLYGHD